MRGVLEPNAEGANKRQLAAAGAAGLASSKTLAVKLQGLQDRIEAGAAQEWLVTAVIHSL